MERRFTVIVSVVFFAFCSLLFPVSAVAQVCENWCNPTSAPVPGGTVPPCIKTSTYRFAVTSTIYGEEPYCGEHCDSFPCDFLVSMYAEVDEDNCDPGCTFRFYVTGPNGFQTGAAGATYWFQDIWFDTDCNSYATVTWEITCSIQCGLSCYGSGTKQLRLICENC
ncbi:MAG: hypothetical protein AB1486_30235 [Planctomycetota bacterium]